MNPLHNIGADSFFEDDYKIVSGLVLKMLC